MSEDNASKTSLDRIKESLRDRYDQFKLDTMDNKGRSQFLREKKKQKRMDEKNTYAQQRREKLTMLDVRLRLGEEMLRERGVIQAASEVATGFNEAGLPDVTAESAYLLDQEYPYVVDIRGTPQVPQRLLDHYGEVPVRVSWGLRYALSENGDKTRWYVTKRGTDSADITPETKGVLTDKNGMRLNPGGWIPLETTPEYIDWITTHRKFAKPHEANLAIPDLAQSFRDKIALIQQHEHFVGLDSRERDEHGVLTQVSERGKQIRRKIV